MLSPNHSNILDVARPQTNSGSVCISLCAGQVLVDTVYLLVEGTCASTKKETGQEVSSAKRLAVLVPDASMPGAVVNRVCARQTHKVCDTDSDYVMRKPSRCWLGAVPRYWNFVASCFRFISFAENTSAASNSSQNRYFSTDSLTLFFLFSCP